MLDNNLEPQIVGERVAGESAKARKQVETVIKNANSSMFDLASLLYNVKKNNLYAGHTTFNAYLKSLKFKERRLTYLTKMAEVMDVLGIDRKTYEPIGISKLRAITSLDVYGYWKNPDTGVEVPIKEFIVAFIDKGQQMSLEQIQQHVRTLKGEVGDDAFVILHVKVKQGTLEKVIRPALELMKLHIGTVKKDEEGNALDASDGRALELVCADYLSDPNNNPLGEENGNQENQS